MGESGSGKTTLALGAIGYLPANGRVTAGAVRLNGLDLLQLPPDGKRPLWGAEVAMVYQNPGTALNPTLTIGRQLDEMGRLHLGLGRQEARGRSLEMLDRVKMPDPEALLRRYPHQLSGGMLQRCVIAMALMTHPALLIMDEPTTALDVTTQAVVLDLVAELQREFQSAILYITHDLGVVARICDRVGVMYRGELVEEGEIRAIFKHPQHPYTVGLLAASPRFRLLSSLDPALPDLVPASGPGEARLLEARDVKKHYPVRRGFRGRGQGRGMSSTPWTGSLSG